ncbi:hypothetical protein DQ04_10601000, partial [Trypanosoma grayi]|uniref:hypothetical protein n=1 Tax=Trypanosoma grayi TaxID=71804 RepID=UPI0004F46A16
PPPQAQRKETQCMVCLKRFTTIDPARSHCKRYHEGQGMPTAGKPRGLQENAPEELSLTAVSYKTCGFQRHSKCGLTRHHIVSHGFRLGTLKPSQRRQCEGTSLHLLSCPAFKSLCCHFAAGGGNMEKLCFIQKFAQYLLAREMLCPKRPTPRRTDAGHIGPGVAHSPL